jgi:hypothetical protein
MVLTGERSAEDRVACPMHINTTTHSSFQHHYSRTELKPALCIHSGTAFYFEMIGSAIVFGLETW